MVHDYVFKEQNKSKENKLKLAIIFKVVKTPECGSIDLTASGSSLFKFKFKRTFIRNLGMSVFTTLELTPILSHSVGKEKHILFTDTFPRLKKVEMLIKNKEEAEINSQSGTDNLYNTLLTEIRPYAESTSSYI